MCRPYIPERPAPAMGFYENDGVASARSYSPGVSPSYSPGVSPYYGGAGSPEGSGAGGSPEGSGAGGRYDYSRSAEDGPLACAFKKNR